MQKEEQKEPQENEPVGDIEDSYLPEDQEEIEEEFVPRSGCLRGCLIPIATVFVIIMVLGIITYSKRDTIRSSLLKRIIANTQSHVLSDLPDDMDEKAIETAFERIKTAMKEKQIDEEILTEAIEEYQDATRKKPPLKEKKQAINRLVDGLNAAVMLSDR